MTKQQYLNIRNNPEADMMELYYLFFLMRGGTKISFAAFRHLFSVWIMQIMNGLAQVQYYVFVELDKYFDIK